MVKEYIFNTILFEIGFLSEERKLEWDSMITEEERKNIKQAQVVKQPNMTKVGTFGGEMDKIGTFSVTKCWALYDWSLYRARVLRAHAGP